MPEQTPTTGTNLNQLSDDVKRRFANRLRIENEIDAATEDLKSDKKKNWRELKAETGIDAKDLTLFYGLFKREKKAMAELDEEDRVRIQDNLSIMYHALQMGKTLNFLEAIEAPKKPSPVKLVEKSQEDIAREMAPKA